MDFAIIIAIVVFIVIPILVRVFRNKKSGAKNEQSSFTASSFQQFSRSRNQNQRADQNSRLFPIQTKIWFENSQKVISISKYHYNEIIVSYPFLSNFLVTKEQFGILKISLTTQNTLNNLLKEFNNLLINQDQIVQNALYILFVNYGFPNVRSSDQWWELYRSFLEGYQDIIINTLYPEVLSNFLDYGTNKKTSYQEMLNDFKELIAWFQEEVNDLYNLLKKRLSTKKTYGYDHYYDEPKIEVSNEILRAYKSLGLNPNATDQEVKRQYRKLANLYHPDRNHSEEAKEKMLKINAAYAIIKKERDL